MTNILIIDDDAAFCLMIKTLLEKNRYRVTAIFSPAQVERILRQRFYEVVLTDLRLPDISGIDLIRLIKNESPATQIIMMTGYADISSAIQSIKQGAFNYLSKPFQPEEVLTIISEALDEADKKKEAPNNNHYSEQIEFLDGESEVSKELSSYIHIVAPTPMSILITGESGTGKEYIARTIHSLSSRSDKPFIAVDCGAIPRELVPSEFFGHIKGSFTGAVADKTGYFEAADKGTLFLDEVGNLSYNTQVQLLRTLQERLIRPVGSNREIPVDIRIVAATNEDLRKAQGLGTFREDLYHRLNEFQINVPPVRERKGDIMLFARHFLRQANKYLNKSVSEFDPEVETVFINYAWPGNLREMKNVVKRATLLARGKKISLQEISPEIYNPSLQENRLNLFNENNEITLIQKALETTGFNKTKAARLLNIDRKTLYNKIKRYDIL